MSWAGFKNPFSKPAHQQRADCDCGCVPPVLSLHEQAKERARRRAAAAAAGEVKKPTVAEFLATRQNPVLQARLGYFQNDDAEVMTARSSTTIEEAATPWDLDIAVQEALRLQRLRLPEYVPAVDGWDDATIALLLQLHEAFMLASWRAWWRHAVDHSQTECYEFFVRETTNDRPGWAAVVRDSNIGFEHARRALDAVRYPHALSEKNVVAALSRAPAAVVTYMTPSIFKEEAVTPNAEAAAVDDMLVAAMTCSLAEDEGEAAAAAEIIREDADEDAMAAAIIRRRDGRRDRAVNRRTLTQERFKVKEDEGAEAVDVADGIAMACSLADDE